MTASGPNPWFWAQNHGFKPDVVIYNLTSSGASQKPSQNTQQKTGLQPDTSKLVKPSPHDAMLAKGASITSIIGGPCLHFWLPMHPMTLIRSFLSRTPLGALRLVFKTARAHDADFGRFWGPQKCFKNLSLPGRFASKAHGRNEGPMMHRQRGSAAPAPPHMEVNF